MGEAKPKSWKRDLARAVLLAALLVGLPAAGVAGARYRKHIQAGYWAWKWARASKGHGEPFRLADKLEAIRAPHGAWVMACRLAYAHAEGNMWKYAAADALEIRDLYALVRQEGAGSPAEEALLNELGTGAYSDLATPPDGAVNVQEGSILPPDSSGDSPWCEKLIMKYDYGSYRFRLYKEWSRSLKPDGTWGKWKHHPPGCIVRNGDGWHAKRLPGPWRDLPPAPPRPPEPPDDEKLYKKL